MLVVTTTVGVLDGVHGNTSNLGPAVALDSVLVVGAASLEHRLIDTATTGDDTDGTTAVRLDGLLGTRRKSDTSSVGLNVVGDDGGVVTGSAGKGTAVSRALLNVGDDGTLGKRLQGKAVSDLELGLLAAVHELASVETLDGDEVQVVLAKLVGVAELNLGERGATSGVVDDVLDNSLDVSITLGVVQSTKLGSSLSVGVVGFEDRSTTLTLSTNDTTHDEIK
jgi:hypothetical protein